jgi:hypothetical protein
LRGGGFQEGLFLDAHDKKPAIGGFFYYCFLFPFAVLSVETESSSLLRARQTKGAQRATTRILKQQLLADP